MEQFDLHLIIGKQRPIDGIYPLTIVKADGKRYRAKLNIPPKIDAPVVFAHAGHDLGSYLYVALDNAGLQNLLWDQYNLILANGPYSRGALLLEISAQDLYGLPWRTSSTIPH